MKNLMLGILLCAGFYLLFQGTRSHDSNDNQPVTIARLPIDMPIRVVYEQDVSGSTKKNGVELIRSSIFQPYFENTNRTVDLYFGVISDSSAKKLTHLFLAAKTFAPPLIPSLSSASVTERRLTKEAYEKLLKKYQADSSYYYKMRRLKIADFCHVVDSIVNFTRKKLSPRTDLITAINIADKVFNYSENDAIKNYLILNSDGLDTFHRKSTKLKNDETVILVNASGVRKTSIDGIIKQNFQASEQAIQYSLNVND